jgi:hypothetical protein
LCSEQSHAYHTQEEPRVPLAFYRYFRTSPPAWPPARLGHRGPEEPTGLGTAGECRPAWTTPAPTGPGQAPSHEHAPGTCTAAPLSPPRSLGRPVSSWLCAVYRIVVNFRAALTDSAPLHGRVGPQFVGPTSWRFAATPLRREKTMLQGVLINETIAVLCQCARDFVWSTGTWTIQPALGALLGKALLPCAEGRIGQVARRGDGMDVGACDDLTDGLRAAKDAGLLRLREHGLERRQRLMAHVAFEGAHRVAPWRRMTFMLHVTYSDALLIGAKWLRLKFFRFCSQAPWGVPWFVALQGISSGESGFKSH